MKSSLDTLSPTRVKLTVEVPFDELDEHLRAAYKRISTQVSIPGFRRGKVPAMIIDQRIGRAAVLEEAVNQALPGKYDEALRTHDVVVLGQPEVEVTELNDGTLLAFTAEVDIRPEFELPEYADLRVQVDESQVTDQQVDAELNSLRKRFATVKPVERPAAAGDLVLLDIEGAVDDEPIEGLKAKAYSHEVGTEGLIPGADAAIVGLAAGESTDFTFTPESGEHTGQELTFQLAVKEVQEQELPAADDEFASMASEFDTIDELKADIRSRLERSGLADQGYAAREKLLEALLESVELPVPESVIAAQIEQHFESDHGHGHGHGHGDADADAESADSDPDSHREEVAENARRAMRVQFILDKIADVEELSVGQAELTHWLVTQSQRYGMAPDGFADALVQAGQVQSAVAEVRRGKALALVLEKAAITDTAGNLIDLKKLEERSAGGADPSEADSAHSAV